MLICVHLCTNNLPKAKKSAFICVYLWPNNLPKAANSYSINFIRAIRGKPNFPAGKNLCSFVFICGQKSAEGNPSFVAILFHHRIRSKHFIFIPYTNCL